MKQMLKVSDHKQQLNVRFNMIAGSVGMRYTRWARLTIILFSLWTLGTSFLCFQKTDFLNLTVGICGLFILLDPDAENLHPPSSSSCDSCYLALLFDMVTTQKW
jgi:hypothetical protein